MSDVEGVKYLYNIRVGCPALLELHFDGKKCYSVRIDKYNCTNDFDLTLYYGDFQADLSLRKHLARSKNTRSYRHVSERYQQISNRKCVICKRKGCLYYSICLALSFSFFFLSSKTAEVLSVQDK